MTAPTAGGDDRCRIRLDVAYDGSAFFGWASQPGLRTVQATIETALEIVLRQPAGSCRLTVAGRTDAGVHARGQVCHVDLPAEAFEVERLAGRLNRLLPEDVVVRRARVAPNGFDARFSASWRRYAYRICDLPDSVDPLRRHEVLGWPRSLDQDAMNAGARGLLGEHDFAAFCKRREGASSTRDLHELAWSRVDGLLVCRVVANAFCHNMVRALVGCLVVVGEHRQEASWPGEVLASGERSSRVPVLAAHGLTLEEVGYPASGVDG